MDNPKSFDFNLSILKTEEIYQKYSTHISGLSLAEVEKRVAQYGKNKISSESIQWWQILLRQLKSPFIYLLFFAVIISFFFGEVIDSVLIIAFILINTILGFVQEFHSEKSLKLLNKFIITRAKVRRHGKEEMINAEDLVPGDMVMVEEGDKMPADLRFLESSNLIVDESILTGESIEVTKRAEALKKAPTALHEAVNIGFSGTTVRSGKGLGVVINTGKNSVMGQISTLTLETKRESLFEIGIGKFSRFILKMIVTILILVFAANLIIKGENANLVSLILFSVALAISVIPEALPVVTTLSLSRGALQLAKSKVVVRRLSAVEDLGSIEILCTDKTGTLTENELKVAEVKADDPTDCIFHGVLASSFLSQNKHQREPNNSFDIALWDKLHEKERKELDSYKRINEVPFDPILRRNEVLVEDKKGNSIVVVRGALEAILPLCKITKEKNKEFTAWAERQGDDGRRVIAIGSCVGKSLENCKNFKLLGLISFIDPIKSSTKSAVQEAKKLGVTVKILTGDAKEVAGAVGFEIGIAKSKEEVLTGAELEAMSLEEQHQAVFKYNIFARVSPQQKYLIIEFEVGFLGEGINDAPALKLANVALVVEGAADISRDAADVVLLKSSLAVIIQGIKQGREIFANTVKYIKITLISNFGNFYAIAVASLIISYLPMLPAQILLLNLLSDFPMIAIAMDSVDVGELKRPRNYNLKEVTLVAITLGIISTVFDFIFFALFRTHNPADLQTCWFIGSVLTEIALIYSVRTKGIFWRAKRPASVLAFLSVFAVAVTVALPFFPISQEIFKFVAPSRIHLLMIFTVVALYFFVTELVKIWYYRFLNSKEGAR
jgi:Mg2+-importing ATPase